MPLFSGVVIDDATPSAVGANIAAPRPARARLRSTVFRSEANALMALPTTKMASALTSRGLRGHPPPTAAITGAMMANDSAYTATICPARLTDVSSEAATLGRMSEAVAAEA